MGLIKNVLLLLLFTTSYSFYLFYFFNIKIKSFKIYNVLKQLYLHLLFL